MKRRLTIKNPFFKPPPNPLEDPFPLELDLARKRRLVKEDCATCPEGWHWRDGDNIRFGHVTNARDMGNPHYERTMQSTFAMQSSPSATGVVEMSARAEPKAIHDELKDTVDRLIAATKLGSIDAGKVHGEFKRYSAGIGIACPTCGRSEADAGIWMDGGLPEPLCGDTFHIVNRIGDPLD